MSVTDPEKVEFIQGLTKDVIHGRRLFFDHLVNTAEVVEKLCKDIGIKENRYLIDAALFHSVYGTHYFENKNDTTREQVTLLIGEKAETLVNLFCTLPERQIQILQHKFKPDQMQRDLYILEYGNTLEQTICDVRSIGYPNPICIFILKLLRANLIDHYNLQVPPFEESLIVN
tara:strand:- start:26 stop:544 length:519 start_codon:yes stop_codon:yes gene_type:complete